MSGRKQFYQSLSILVDAAANDPHRQGSDTSESAALARQTLVYCLEEMRVLQAVAQHRQRAALRRWTETGAWGDDPGVIIIE